jgi:hypothetical protein
MSTGNSAVGTRAVSAVALRVVTAGALLVDAVVHLHLAPGYQLSAPDGVGAGNLFRLQAAAGLAVLVWVLIRGSRASFAAAFLVGLSAVGAVVFYRYVNLPAFGPLPAMYEPVWFLEKSVSAIAEAAAAVVAAVAIFSTAGPGRRK